MPYLQPVEQQSTDEPSCTVKYITAKTDISKLPLPEIHLRGPPVLSTTTQLQGTISLSLLSNSNHYLKELSLKLEASAVTWSPGVQPLSRQKKRLYVERQTLWRQTTGNILSSQNHSFDFIFAMPPGYLPPSFRFNNRVYIQYRLRVVAVFEQGRRRNTCDLAHHPISVLPEEKWGLAAAQNWIVIQPGISVHPPTHSQTRSYSKMCPTLSTKNTETHKLSIRDRLRGRRLYPIRLEGMYLDSGVLANTTLESVQIQLVREELPLVQLRIHKITVGLTAITKVSVHKARFVERENIALVRRIIDKPLGAEVAVDITDLIGPITLPRVDSSFHTKTLSRSYKLVVCCEIVAGDIMSEVYITLPITIFGNSNDGILPVYSKEIELPAYTEFVEVAAL